MAPDRADAPSPARSRMLPIGEILARALALHPGRDFAMYSGTPFERTVRYARAGEVIEWTDDGGIQALSTGVYGRYAVRRGAETTGHRWLFLCPLHDLGSLIEHDRPVVGDFEIAGIAPAAAWWASCAQRRRSPGMDVTDE